jgi:hypothetical protein
MSSHLFRAARQQPRRTNHGGVWRRRPGGGGGIERATDISPRLVVSPCSCNELAHPMASSIDARSCSRCFNCYCSHLH